MSVIDKWLALNLQNKKAATSATLLQMPIRPCESNDLDVANAMLKIGTNSPYKGAIRQEGENVATCSKSFATNSDLENQWGKGKCSKVADVADDDILQISVK